MNRLHSLFATMLVAATALLFNACEDTTNVTTPTVFVPKPASDIMACSIGDSTIRIAFTPSTSESNSAFKDYALVITTGSSSQTLSLPKGYQFFDISNLIPGKSYTFSLSSRTADTTSTAITITWATATRYVGIRAYERASVLGSGIDLLNGRNQTISSAELWDLCFDAKDSTFGPPSASSFAGTDGKINGKTAKRTSIYFKDIDTPYTVNADSLNQIFETKALNDTSSQRKIKISKLIDVKKTSGFVVYVITQDNRFAKLHVKAKNGNVIQRDANGAFVEIDASVQKLPLIPYAMKQRAFDFDGPVINASQQLNVSTN